MLEPVPAGKVQIICVVEGIPLKGQVPVPKLTTTTLDEAKKLVPVMVIRVPPLVVVKAEMVAICD